MAVSYTIDGTEFMGAPPLTTTGDTTQRLTLGTMTRGKDATYGQADFIYVKFSGTVAAGDFCIVDRFNKTCIQTPALAGSALGFAVGVSMAAQSANTYGWVMVRGIHDGANIATGTASGSLLSGSATAGRASTAVANYKLDCARSLNAPSSNVGAVELWFPSVNGRA